MLKDTEEGASRKPSGERFTDMVKEELRIGSEDAP